MSKITNKIFIISSIFFAVFHFFLSSSLKETTESMFLNDLTFKSSPEDFYLNENINIFACINDAECEEKYKQRVRLEILKDNISSVSVFDKTGNLIFGEYSGDMDKIISTYAFMQVKNTDSERADFVSDEKTYFFAFKAIPLIDVSAHKDEDSYLEGEFFSDGYVVLNYNYSDSFKRLKEFAFAIELFFVVLIFLYCFMVSKWPSTLNKPIINFYKKSYALENEINDIRAREKEKSNFFARFSHELRTPLNSIIGFSEIISKKSSSISVDKIKSYSENIYNSGNYLLSIINDLMDYFKLEVQGIAVDMSEVNVKSVVDRSVEMLQCKADEKNIELSSFIEDDNLEIEGDSSRLQQVIVNLVSNSIKFTPREGAVSILVKKIDDEKIAIEISDNGIGVKKDDIPKIFSAFGQVDAERKKSVTNAKSTGLGMNIAKQLVELMQGEMTFESRVNVGTKVNLIMNKSSNQEIEKKPYKNK